MCVSLYVRSWFCADKDELRQAECLCVCVVLRGEPGCHCLVKLCSRAQVIYPPSRGLPAGSPVAGWKATSFDHASLGNLLHSDPLPIPSLGLLLTSPPTPPLLPFPPCPPLSSFNLRPFSSFTLSSSTPPFLHPFLTVCVCSHPLARLTSIRLSKAQRHPFK